MRTRIACGWLVAHAQGHHTLWRHAELVFEGNTVLFIGEHFDGRVDQEIDAGDKLVHRFHGTDHLCGIHVSCDGLYPDLDSRTGWKS